MDQPIRPREIPVKELVRGTDTRDMLAHAAQQSEARNLKDYLIIDVDAHHFETQSWDQIVEYIPDPVIQDLAKSFVYGGKLTPGIMQSSAYPFHQSVGRRITHDDGLEENAEEDGFHRDTVLVRRALDCMSIDYQILFPTPMLGLGMHPETDVEVAVAHGYNRWLVDQVLCQDPRIKTMLYLPFNDPPACERMVEEFAGVDGVQGFMVTSVRHRPVHHNSYLRLYSMIQETGLPLGFHAGPTWGGGDGYLRQLNRFLSVHAISFPLSNMVHMANWVMNGMCEKFPGIKVIWIEAGITWMAFMTTRFDNEYLMRSSEAPALKRMPSEYMQEMYYTTQPMERTNMELLEATFKAMNGTESVLYASDWPHWDFDLPSTVLDLPFLDEQAKRNILGLNAQKLFNLPVPERLAKV